jgi:hypothetical protein
MVKLTQFLNCKYRRLSLSIWIDVKPVEILTIDVHPVMTMIHPIWVKHRDHFEDKVLSEEMGPSIIR